jgi:UDP-glucose 4-epimerase
VVEARARRGAGLRVAVTGPTGQIGRAVVRELEREPKIARILGMARRPFDPASQAWRKVEYRLGDVLDRAAVRALAAESDVVVHLAYLIRGSRRDSQRVNLTGSRNVFEAAVAAGRPRRLVYTSSVAAYGYRPDNPVPLTEEVPARGSAEHYYSAQKAACEAVLVEVTAGHDLSVYVLRPCVVAGPEATLLLDSMPWRQAAQRLPAAVTRAVSRVPGLRPVLPDPGLAFQLVHHDDVATAVRAAVVGAGPRGAYNLAGDGEITVAELARALDGYPVPIPHALVDLAAVLVGRLPLRPTDLEWVHAVRYPMVVDTAKARRLLGWRPRYTTHDTLLDMVRGVRASGA